MAIKALKVGRKYKSRCGDVIEIVRKLDAAPFPFVGRCFRGVESTFRENGAYGHGSDSAHDLVEHVIGFGDFIRYDNNVVYRVVDKTPDGVLVGYNPQIANFWFITRGYELLEDCKGFDSTLRDVTLADIGKPVKANIITESGTETQDATLVGFDDGRWIVRKNGCIGYSRCRSVQIEK